MLRRTFTTLALSLTVLMLISLIYESSVLAENAKSGDVTRKSRKPGSSGSLEKKPGPRGTQGGLREDHEAKLLAVLKEKLPAQYEMLMQLKDDRPRAYHHRIRRMYGWYKQWRNLPEDLQQASVVEKTERMKSFRLVRSIRTTEDVEQKALLKGQLSESIAKQFDAKQKRNAYRLEQLKKRIVALEEELKDRAKRRKEILAERVEAMISDEKSHRPGASWKSSGPGSSRPDDRRRGFRRAELDQTSDQPAKQ